MLHTLLLVLSVHTTAQDVELRTNMLYWMTTTPNAGVDVRLSDHITVGASLGYNAFNFSTSTGSRNNRLNPKIHHWSVMPEGQWWFDTPYRGSYVSLHLLCGEFNAGGISFPKFLKNHRYRGYAAGAGLSYGHVWSIGRDWRVGVAAGLSVVRLDYRRYDCGSCGTYTGHFVKYVPIIPVGVSIAYVIPVCKNPTVSLHHPAECHAMVSDDVCGADIDPVPPLQSVTVNDVSGADDTVSTEITENTEIAENTAIAGMADIPASPDTLRVIIRHDVDRSVLSRSEASRIDSLLSAIKGREIIQVSVSGYASPEYNAEHNRRLSEQRAMYVAYYMAENSNIPYSLMETNGYGDDWEGLFNILSEMEDFELSTLIGCDSEGRKRMIRQFENYNRILTVIYPMLRRTEVKVIVK